MILVGGFNSAIDRHLELDDLRIGEVNRVRGVDARPGGKGLHVASTVAELGEEAVLLGIIDDLHAPVFSADLAARGVRFEGVRVAGGIRTCVAVRDASGRTTELLEPGPEVDAPAAETLRRRFRALADGASAVVLSGSLPRGLADTTYAELIRGLPGARCLLDTSGEALRAGVAAKPYLVKPNRDEARALTRLPVDGVAGAEDAARILGHAGIAFAVISLGDVGAVAATADGVLFARAPPVRAASAVGSGDCLLGGVATALARGWDPPDALRLGVACGAANALNPGAGTLRRADVDALLPQVTLAPPR